MANKTEIIWVFHGASSRFTSGVFSSLDIADEWIRKHNLTGTLTKYPLNIGVYDWCLENELFEIKTENEASPDFIQNFTSASQEHLHYEGGERC